MTIKNSSVMITQNLAFRAKIPQKALSMSCKPVGENVQKLMPLIAVPATTALAVLGVKDIYTRTNTTGWMDFGDGYRYSKKGEEVAMIGFTPLRDEVHARINSDDIHIGNNYIELKSKSKYNNITCKLSSCAYYQGGERIVNVGKYLLQVWDEKMDNEDFPVCQILFDDEFNVITGKDNDFVGRKDKSFIKFSKNQDITEILDKYGLKEKLETFKELASLKDQSINNIFETIVQKFETDKNIRRR